MKKHIVFLLIAMFLFSFVYAEADEITFQSIPWLTDDVTVMKALNEAGLIRNYSLPALSQGNASYIVKDESDFFFPSRVMGVEEVTYTANLNDNVKGKIGGYLVKGFDLAFAYDGEYRLIAVNVKVLNATYDGLKEKLTKVYGEGEEHFNEDDIGYTIWKGDNDTCILLFTYIRETDYTLMYGRLDAEEILANCLVPDPNDISGL